jgi:hypothetical protein
MNKMLLVAAAAVALAGCNKAAAPADNSASNAAAATNTADTNATDMNATAPAAAAMVTANGSPPGTYDVAMKDGSKGKTTLNADGTYTDVDSNGKETKGTWAVKDGKTCFTPTGKTAECYTESAVGADGSFTATSAKGETVTVKKAS